MSVNVSFGIIGHTHLVLPDAASKGHRRMPRTDRPPAESRYRDGKQALTFNWMTWLYIDCCCDTCSIRQRFPNVTVFGTDLVDEDGLPKLFYESDDFLGILRLVEDSGDLSLLRQCQRSDSNVVQRPMEGRLA